MIKKINIKNFEGYKKAELEFSEGTNVIIGKSDSGKSTIKRAIEWVTFNRPLGDGYRRRTNDEKISEETIVSLSTNEGDEIIRIKGDKINEYHVNRSIFKAFGHNPPEEVFSTINIDYNNIHSQFDLPFLLSLSPGEAAKFLNTAASIDEIDRSVSYLQRNIGRIKTKLNLLKEEKTKTKEQLKDYEEIESIETLFEKADTLLKEKTQEEIKLADIKKKKARIEEVSRILEKIDKVPIDELLSMIEDGITKIKRLQQINKQFKGLKTLVDKLRTKEEKIERLDEDITIKTRKLEELMPDICPICNQSIKGTIDDLY